METNLRPLTLGEILDRTAQLYRENFLLFAGIFSGIFLINSALSLILRPLLIRSAANGKTPQIPDLVPFFIVFGIEFLVIFLLFGAATAAVTRAVAWIQLGKPATIKTAYQSILPILGRYFWLQIIAGFMIILVGLGSFLGSLAIVLVLGVVLGRGGAPGVLIIIAGVIAYIVPIALALRMGLRYSLAVPACVVENLKARKAIRRSVELSKGSRGRIFVLWLLVVIVDITLAVITQMFFIIYSARHQNYLPTGLAVAQAFVSFLTNTFVAPILATGLTLFYFDQRIRNEGFDIEWMMQAAGLTFAEPEPAPIAPAAPLSLTSQETGSVHE